jgi:serine/threonine-protein kinase HipA
MTSDVLDSLFVWIWLPGSIEPVVAGRLDRRGHRYTFSYGRSYLDRTEAVPIYLPELPLDRLEHDPLDGAIPLCLDDAGPDSWGRAVINAHLGQVGNELDILTYLVESGSDRVGALDFQRSPTEYVPRAPAHAPLEQLLAAADVVAAGKTLDPDLAEALVNGTPLGGARPKALIEDEARKYLAKFSRSTDTFLWVQSEYVAMELARRCGLHVAPVRYVETMGRGVLLVERFDRTPIGTRDRVVSAATVVGMQTLVAARHFTYTEFADAIRARFVEPDATLRELFARIMFNILVGNTDDHARNHAAFVLGAGDDLKLTPAFDISPQPRSGQIARHPQFGPTVTDRDSRIAALVAAAPIYHLDPSEAQQIADRCIETIRSNWDEVCDQGRLTSAQQHTLMGGPILNEFAFFTETA